MEWYWGSLFRAHSIFSCHSIWVLMSYDFPIPHMMTSDPTHRDLVGFNGWKVTESWVRSKWPLIPSTSSLSLVPELIWDAFLLPRTQGSPSGEPGSQGRTGREWEWVERMGRYRWNGEALPLFYLYLIIFVFLIGSVSEVSDKDGKTGNICHVTSSPVPFTIW